MSLFYPKSIEFVKSRAKQLQRAFPSLSLSTCQNAAAQALGFKDWFEATKRIGSPGIVPSKQNESVAHLLHLERRYDQTRALIDTAGLPALEADYFVRRWNLTSSEPSRLEDYIFPYNELAERLAAYERGDLSEYEVLEMSGDEMPTKIAEGIILARSGRKHSYFHLSLELLRKMPPFLRTASSLLLEYEDSHNIPLAFPHLFTREEVLEALAYLEDQHPLQFEWYTGRKAEGYDGMSLATMLAQAKEYPQDLFALALRFPNDSIKLEYTIPALTGSEFCQFIDTKGSLAGLNVQWVRPKPTSHIVNRLSHVDMGYELTLVPPGIRLDQKDVEPGTPLYGWPFKFGPMSSREYDPQDESGGLMLSTEIFDDDDEGGGGGGDDLPVLNIGPKSMLSIS